MISPEMDRRSRRGALADDLESCQTPDRAISLEAPQLGAMDA
jgi:hypothetical protein